MAPLCTSAEVNLLVYHYLKESGFLHASFSLRHEARLDDSPLSKEAIVEPDQLVRYLQKGLIYAAVEAHVQQDGSEKPCSAPFRLIGPPHVCDGKPRPSPPPASPTRLSPEPSAKPERALTKETATQTPTSNHAALPNLPVLTNGVHTGATTSPSQSRNVSGEHNSASSVASSSRKKLDDVTEEASTTVKSKDVKRKASTSSVVEKTRDDKRSRRDSIDRLQSNKAIIDDNGDKLKGEENNERRSARATPSRSSSPTVEKKSNPNAVRNKERELGNKKKKGGKSTTAENGDANKKSGKDASSRPKDPKALNPQPTGENYIEDNQITNLSGHTGEVFISAWNPTVPNMLASGGGDATVRIWEVPEKAGEPIESPTICKHLPAAQSKDISTLDWNPDGTLLASGSYDGIVRLWTPQGDLHLVMSMHQGPVISVRWNRKGNMLLTGSADGTIIVWDLNSGKPRHTYPLHSDSVLDVEWLSTAEGSVKPPLSSDAPPHLPHGLSLSSADTYFATCSADNSINLCKLGEPKAVKSFRGHTDEVNAIRFDPSQTLLASVSDDNTAKIWALELSGTTTNASAGLAGDSSRGKRGSQRRGGSAHPDGMDIDEEPAHRTADEGEHEADRSTPTSTGVPPAQPKDGVTPVGSNGLASNANAPANAITHKGPNKGLQLTLSGHSKELYAVAWCPTGPGSTHPEQPRMLATTSFDWTARLWNADTGDCMRVITGHEDNVYTLRFSPCARYLATGGIDKRVLISRVDNGDVVKRYMGGGAIFDMSWKDIPSPGKESSEETALASHHQLAVSQADRKLVVLNLANLDANSDEAVSDQKGAVPSQ